MGIIIPFLVVISSLILGFSRNLRMDSDHIWSIAVGRWISANNAVPFVDHFSWTVYGKEWFSNSWLFCWLIYHLDSYLGYLGVILMISAVYLAAGYYIYLICKKFYPPTLSTLAFTLGMFTLILLSMMPRAYIFTFAFLAVIFYLIRFKRDTKLIYLIPVILLLWANIQSSMRFGVGILFVEALVGTLFYKDRRLWPVVGLSFLATLVNPYGIRFWDFSFAGVFSMGTLIVAEWNAPDFNDMGILILFLFLGTTAIFAFNRLQRPYDRDRLMIFFWYAAAFLYSLTTIRALHYVLLLWAPCFAAFAARTDQENRLLKPLTIALVLVLFLSAAIAGMPQLYADLKPADGRPVSTVEFTQRSKSLEKTTPMLIPAGAVAFLEENPALQDRLFNKYSYGAYLMLNEIPVFIDARESVFTQNNVTADYADITRLTVRPEVIIEKYGIRNFLIYAESPLAFYLEALNEWEEVYRDETTVIFTRKGGLE